MTAGAADQRLEKLAALVQLGKSLRRAENAAELSFVATNDSRRVVEYRQSLFWTVSDRGRVDVESAHGVSEVDANAPAICFIREVIIFFRSQGIPDEGMPLTASDLPEGLRQGWAEYMAPYGLLLPVTDSNGRLVGGFLFASDDVWSESAQALLAEMVDVFRHARTSLVHDGYRRRLSLHLRKHQLVYLLVLFAVLLFPIRQYILAPAEVVPASPFIVAAPMSGVIDAVEIEPNQQVDEGQLLFSYEDIELRNQLETKRKAVEVAQAELARNSQQAFNCDECRSRLPELKAILERERAELLWTQEKLEMARVYAPHAGVAIFPDASDLEGRPVDVGQLVMKIADVSDTKLKINVPIDDAISVEPGTEVILHLNVDPLTRYPATIVTSSYEPVALPDKTLAYPVNAEFSDEAAKLGLRGTAKVYGSRAPLVYYLFRRPIAWLRRTTGY